MAETLPGPNNGIKGTKSQTMLDKIFSLTSSLTSGSPPLGMRVAAAVGTRDTNKDSRSGDEVVQFGLNVPNCCLGASLILSFC